MKAEHLIFLHLPKTAGSTTYYILNRLYREKKVFDIHWRGTEGNLDDFRTLPPDKREKVKLIRGHYKFGLHEFFEGNTSYFSFLRKPEDRILSFYTYVQRIPENRLYKKVVDGKMTFKQFILLHDIDGNNGQIRKISGVDSDEKIMLDKAINNINDYFPVVGLQEYFDESLIVLAHYFKWPIPYYIKRNVSKKKKKIANSELQLIKEFNQGDYQLYDFVKSRLMSQIKEVPYFKLKLVRLKTINYIISNNFLRVLLGKKRV